MLFTQYGYSGYTNPILYGLDLLCINLLAFFLPIQFEYPVLFHSYISLCWTIIAFKTGFYGVYRYTKVTHILKLLFTQFVVYFLVLYAFIGFFKQPNISRLALGYFFLSVFGVVFFLKFFTYVIMQRFWEKGKGNIRHVVIIGKNRKTEQLIKMFNKRTEYGYHFVKQFCPNEEDFDLHECFLFIVENKIDEIYCAVSELGNTELIEFINFADNNLRTLKFLPDNKNIYAKKLKFEYYDYLPILSLREIPLHDPINAFIKRTFDIAFSLVVIFGLLIWLAPVLAIIIALESRGPVFFIQERTGFDNRKFSCYKFRSMAINPTADVSQAGKNDVRVTKVGRFIRSTSIDELPQFYNVLFGHMSVVGPRPHMLSHTDEYANTVDKYMLRHFVKPGITGLAQVRGYRGEIERHSDIQNRIKFDIFYVENWSFFLDIKIIVQTILNAFSGEEKAY